VTSSSARDASWPGLQPIKGAVWRAFDCIGPELHGRADGINPPASPDWIALLCLNAAVALFLVAIGQGEGMRGAWDASLFFWAGVVLLLLPTATRAAWPGLARGERIFLLLLLGEGLFVYRLLYSPTSFVHFDAMLHWMSAQDILFRHKLFLNNPLLPISPAFPGLEILTTALANLAGFAIFPAAVLVIAALRATFIAALFLFFETLTQSPRAAALACLVYMGCDNFVQFDSLFAYETLGLVFCVLVIMAEAKAARRAEQDDLRVLALILALLAALAITHHVSAFACAGYLIGVLILEVLRRDPAGAPGRFGVLAPLGLAVLAFPALWIMSRGAPLSSYLGPVLDRGIDALMARLDGGANARKLFVSANGVVQPLGYRVLGILWTLLIAIGLSTGFFRSLALTAATSERPGMVRLAQIARRKWRDSRVVLLTLAAFGFPISVAFRLTGAGWEIGNRMGAFVFIAVGLVVAVAIVHFWQPRKAPWRLAATSLALGIILLGGLAIGSANQAVRGPYTPGADAASIEPMGIAASSWTRQWLGEGNRFASDRVNRLLLATYGQQEIVTTINAHVDESRIFLTRRITPDVLYWIKKGRIDYLLVDLRITTAPALLGRFYEADEPGQGAPPPPSMLLKFDTAPHVARIFDDGWIVIFDVRALHADS
jgi:hypothetical protein